MEAAGLCLQALWKLKQLYDTLDENWQDSKRLLQRCLLFEQFVQEKFEKIQEKEKTERDKFGAGVEGEDEESVEMSNLRKAEEKAMGYLQERFSKSIQFVEKYQEKTYKSMFLKVIWSNGYAKELTKLNQNLTQAANDWKIVAEVTQPDYQEGVKAALETIKTSIQTVLAQNMNRDDFNENRQQELIEEINQNADAIPDQIVKYYKPSSLTGKELKAWKKDLENEVKQIQKDSYDHFKRLLKEMEKTQQERTMLLAETFLSRDIEMKRAYQLENLRLEPRLINIQKDTSNKLGEGGFGIVYRGTYQNTEVAVKIISLKHDMKGKSYDKQEDKRKNLRKIENELLLCQLLNRGPHVLKNFGFVQTQEEVQIVMELGMCSLEHLLSHPMEWQKINQSPYDRKVLKIAWIYDMMLGIEYLHDQRVKHRDIKPANVLVFPNLQLKLCDFGLAKEEKFKGVGATMSTVGAVGTHLYIAPEMFEKGKAYYASDIFAWVISALHILDDKPPQCQPMDHRGREHAIKQIMARQLEKISSDIRSKFEQLLKTCASRNHEERFPAPYINSCLKRIVSYLGGDPRSSSYLPPVTSRKGRTGIANTKDNEGIRDAASVSKNHYSLDPINRDHQLAAMTEELVETDTRIVHFLQYSAGKATAYEVLQLQASRRPSLVQIKKAFDRDLLRFCIGYHPDSNRFDKMVLQLILAAYDLLRHEQSRRLYDFKLNIYPIREDEADEEADDHDDNYHRSTYDEEEQVKTHLATVEPEVVIHFDSLLEDILQDQTEQMKSMMEEMTVPMNPSEVKEKFPSLFSKLVRKIRMVVRSQMFLSKPSMRGRRNHREGMDMIAVNVMPELSKEEENYESIVSDGEEEEDYMKFALQSLDPLLGKVEGNFLLKWIDLVWSGFGTKIDDLPILESMNDVSFAVYSSRALILHKCFNMIILAGSTSSGVALLPEFIAIVTSILIFMFRYRVCIGVGFFIPLTEMPRKVAVLAEFVCLIATLAVADQLRVNDAAMAGLFFIGLCNLWCCIINFYFLFVDNRRFFAMPNSSVKNTKQYFAWSGMQAFSTGESFPAHLRKDPRLWPKLRKAMIQVVNSDSSTNSELGRAERDNLFLELAFRHEAIFFGIGVRLVAFCSSLAILPMIAVCVCAETYRLTEAKAVSGEFTVKAMNTLLLTTVHGLVVSHDWLIKVWVSILLFVREQCCLVSKKKEVLPWQDDGQGEFQSILFIPSSSRKSNKNDFEIDKDSFHMVIRLYLLNRHLQSVMRRRSWQLFLQGRHQACHSRCQDFRLSIAECWIFLRSKVKKCWIRVKRMLPSDTISPVEHPYPKDKVKRFQSQKEWQRAKEEEHPLEGYRGRLKEVRFEVDDDQNYLQQMREFPSKEENMSDFFRYEDNPGDGKE